MNKYIFTLLITILSLSSCSKNDPTAEIDQEELNAASLIFTPVTKTESNGSTNYTVKTGEEVQEIKFSGSQLLPPIGFHLDLHAGHTYKMELKSLDFAGRESQNSFVQRADTHQAFLLNAPENSLEFVYGDNQVGVTAYITVLKETNSFTLRYIMRHLNNGVKANIKASDWNNLNYTQFTGANDLDLQFQAHFTDEHEGH